MAVFDERMLEDYLVDQLQRRGWTYILGNELIRESLEEPLLKNTLTQNIRELNSGLNLTEADVNNTIKELTLIGTGIEGNKRILNLLKEGVPMKLEKQRTLERIKLIDYEDPTKNEYIVSRQVIYVAGRETIRADLVLYVNGIPLVDIELKNPASFSENWYTAYRQIKDYEKQAPELYKYVQIGVAAEQTARYFPITPWQDETQTHQWREKGKNPIDSAIELLTPQTLINIIQNYLFHRIERGEQTKVITRHMQYRAAEKIIKRVKDNLEGKDGKKQGLIWHWQGSGKTLAMIFAANQLYHTPKLENPTIYFIVDRIELEEQLYTEYNALDITQPEIIGSIDELKKAILHDEGRGRRGIQITLIHKFRPEELIELQKELEERQNTLLTRKNVIAFLDEGHRTQYGLLAAQMKKILKNAFFFAFTGTPIKKKGADTYKEFGNPPEELYLDKYFVTESLEDGFTVKIAYQPRLEGKVNLKKEMLEIFLETELEEIPEEAKTEVEERIKKRLNPINVYLEQQHRIELIAADIAEHFKENVDGRYKAMVVAASRKACVLYKQALDKVLPKEYSEVVMTYTRDDIKLIRDYEKQLIERYRGKETDDIKKEVTEKYKEEEKPKILIVTDMLLTGFDAPILQTMYLDKPLREHRLLQAIARTNRPYKDVKVAGLIVDYVGILQEIHKAFENYSKEDWEDVIFNMDDLRTEYHHLIDELMQYFKHIPKDEKDMRNLLKAAEILTEDEEKAKTFLETYKTMRKIFEVLGADEAKIDRLQEYKWLSAVYVYYMRVVLRSKPNYEAYVEKYFQKTIKYAHKTTEMQEIEKNLPQIDFDSEYMRKLEEQTETLEEKTANIVFTLNRYVLVEKHKNPVFESIAEKVERIIELWKEKTKDFEDIYRKGVEVLQEIEHLRERQKKLGLTNTKYSMLLTLEKRLGEDEKHVEDIEDLSKLLKAYMFKNWITQPTARKNVERELRRFIRPYVKKYGLSMNSLEELYQELLNDLKNYDEHSQ